MQCLPSRAWQLTFQPGLIMWLSRTMMGTDKLGEP